MSVKDSFYKVPKVVFLVIAKALKTEVLVIESQGERLISGVLRATGQPLLLLPSLGAALQTVNSGWD